MREIDPPLMGQFVRFPDGGTPAPLMKKKKLANVKRTIKYRRGVDRSHGYLHCISSFNEFPRHPG